jgi:hypothetical protein
MSVYTRPRMETIIEMVKTHDKRIGLRMLYNQYSIPMSERYKYRKLWNTFYDLLPDAFEKELNHARKIRETEAIDGDGSTPAGETVPEESRRAEDVEETVT